MLPHPLASRTLVVALVALSLLRSVDSSAFLMSPTSRSKGAVIVSAGAPCDPLRHPVAEPLRIEPGGKLPVTYFGDDVGTYEFVLAEAENENILDSIDRNSDEALYYRQDTYSLPPANAFHVFNVRIPQSLPIGHYILQMRSRRYRSCSDLVVTRDVPFERSVIALISVGGAGIVIALAALVFLYRKRGGCLLSDGSLIVSRPVDDDKAEEGLEGAPLPQHTQVRMPDPRVISLSVADTQRASEIEYGDGFSDDEEDEEAASPSIRTCFTPSSASNASPPQSYVVQIGPGAANQGPVPSQSQRLPPSVQCLPSTAPSSSQRKRKNGDIQSKQSKRGC